jgi:predicted nucleic acid-binding protein
VQGSNTDFLICAVAERRGLPIFSADAEFHAARVDRGRLASRSGAARAESALPLA